MRERVALVVAASAFALGAAILVHQVRLQRAVGNLQNTVETQAETLDEVLRTQRMVLSALSRLDRRVQELEEKPLARGDKGENGSATASRAAVATQPTEPPAPAPPSPEVQENIQKGNSVIDAAIASGQWSDQNRNDLKAIIRVVPMEQAQALIYRVVSAINARQLHPDRSGPPI